MIFGSVYRVGMYLEKSVNNYCQAGITYIAQVLKRNRTLKVLNLSENKLDVQGLTAVAEALVTILPSIGIVMPKLLTRTILRNTTHRWKPSI